MSYFVLQKLSAMVLSLFISFSFLSLSPSSLSLSQHFFYVIRTGDKNGKDRKKKKKKLTKTVSTVTKCYGLKRNKHYLRQFTNVIGPFFRKANNITNGKIDEICIHAIYYNINTYKLTPFISNCCEHWQNGQNDTML